jgi:hypothetical protein
VNSDVNDEDERIETKRTTDHSDVKIVQEFFLKNSDQVMATKM